MEPATFALLVAGWFFLPGTPRRQRTDDDEVWERRIASEAIRAVATSATKLAPEDYSPVRFFSGWNGACIGLMPVSAAKV